ncbi:hypothetical protein AGDE_15662 [Angomonas deanei]|nr:hypothetical protein AGDE_15662 [Angomonas deanei]|eukprot:EPY18691.1 hypothetical protein AGDE_15662 [Angomonas deanei]
MLLSVLALYASTSYWLVSSSGLPAAVGAEGGPGNIRIGYGAEPKLLEFSIVGKELLRWLATMEPGRDPVGPSVDHRLGREVHGGVDRHDAVAGAAAAVGLAEPSIVWHKASLVHNDSAEGIGGPVVGRIGDTSLGEENVIAVGVGEGRIVEADPLGCGSTIIVMMW